MLCQIGAQRKTCSKTICWDVCEKLGRFFNDEMRRIVTRNVRVSYYGSGHKCSIYFPFGHQQAKEQCNASVLFGEGEFETIEPLIFRCVENFQFFGWFGSKASCLKTLDASREEELRTTRLNRLNILDRLCRLDRLVRLCRLDRLNRLNRLDRLSRLDRLNRLNRLDRLNRLNNHTDTEPLQSSVSGPGQLASGDPSADMSQLHTEEDSLAGGDPPPPPRPTGRPSSGTERTGEDKPVPSSVPWERWIAVWGLLIWGNCVLKIQIWAFPVYFTSFTPG